MPHKLHFVGEEYAGISGAGIFGGLVQQIDWSVGEVAKAIEAQGLEEDTLVFFCSENGPIPEGSAGLMRGNKYSIFEGGMRTPAIFWAPGTVLAGEVSNEILSAIDLFPTFAHYAGAKVPGDRTYDGFNIAELLEGKNPKSLRNEILCYGANTLTPS